MATIINSTSTRMVTKEEMIKAIEDAFKDSKHRNDCVAVVTTVDFGDSDNEDNSTKVQTVAFGKILKF